MESVGLPPPARPGPAATQQEMIEADLLALGELAEAKAGQVVAVLSPGGRASTLALASSGCGHLGGQTGPD